MAANDDVENIPESSAIGVHNDDGDEVVGVNAELLNNQIKIESAILNETNALHCRICLSLPVPPVYHCESGHLLCCKCHDKDAKHCTIDDCKLDTFECKLTSFLLTRMEIICPNKSHGCSSLPLPIKDFTSHVEECSLSHPQYKSSCSYSCPCCVAEYADLEAFISHLESQHELTEVIEGKHITLMMAQRQKRILKVKSSKKYLLLEFKEEAVSLQHMWWDEPRPHDLHVKDWSFIGHRTLDTRSDTVEQYLELPLIPEEVSVKLRIGASIAKPMAVFYLSDLADHANLPEDAAVKILVCMICQKVNSPVIHCTFGHTICLICCRGKTKVEKELGRMDKWFKCPYCTLKIMRCNSGSCILKKSKYYCPNRSLGCQEVMPIARYEMHIENCLKPLCCPMCGQGFDDDELLVLVNHLADDHRPKRVKCMDCFLVLPGRNLIEKVFTNDILLLIFEDNHLCLQHMWWAEPQEYVIEFDDLGSTWSFHGKTVATKRFPTLSAECLKIPKSVLHPKSSNAIAITLTLKHPKVVNQL